MSDFEKVLKGLECCTTALGCKACPYSEKGVGTDDCQLESTQDALELLKEIKPYGGFIEFSDAAGEITGYKAIVERMEKAGILKVEKQEAPMLTRYNWAIKAVKWDDKG